MVFDRDWFKKYQSILLLFANTRIGRYIFRINGDRSKVGDNKIVRIEPNAITWQRSGEYLVTEFRAHDKYSKRLFYAFKKVWQLFHLWDIVVNRVKLPNLNLGFDTFTFYSAAGSGDTAGTDARLISAGDATWATRRSAATSVDGSFGFLIANLTNSTTVGNWTNMNRSVISFDTSSLGADVITSTALNLYKSSSVVPIDSIGIGTGKRNLTLVEVSLTDPDTVATGDWNNYILTKVANDLDYSNYVGQPVAYYPWTLTDNTVVKTDGYTKLGILFTCDYDNDEPTGFSVATSRSSSWQWVSTDETGTSLDPYLEVVYPTPPTVQGIQTIQGIQSITF